MKRIGYLYEQICTEENIKSAHINASKDKSHYPDVIKINADPEPYLKAIRDSLVNKSYETSIYLSDSIVDRGKDRDLHKLPYYPDRIVHHAVMQIVCPILTNCLIRNTFQSIKGRGMMDCRDRISEYISKNRPETFINIDITKFYPSVDKHTIKMQLRTKIKCQDTLNLLDEIIDSAPSGLPIGSYTSQISGNFHLSELDWRMVQGFKIGYFRYCDDILIFPTDASDVPAIIGTIISELDRIKLTAKYVKTGHLRDGVLFVGYRFNQDVTRLSKKVSKRIAATNKLKSLQSYKGLVININNKQLLADTKLKIGYLQ